MEDQFDSLVPIVSTKPAENETVWFFVDNQECHINCSIYDRTGWHLGWWSGTRWHSYMDKEIEKDDSKVKGWLPLRLPEVSKWRQREKVQHEIS